MSPPPAGDDLPTLPPIRTRAAVVADPAPEHASPSTTKMPEEEPLPAPAVAESRTPPAVSDEEEEVVEEAEPRTPTSEESKLRPPTECPPAPRKPVALGRTGPSPKRPVLYFDVPCDLSAVFSSLPPKKRIRAPACLVPCRQRCGAAWADGPAL